MPQKAAAKKMWTTSRKIEVITPSRYEKNEASIKAYWKNYTANLELSYKDDKFWESQAGAVRANVPAITYRKLAKMYNLPIRTKPYYPSSEASGSPVPSVNFYRVKSHSRASRMKYSMSDFESEGPGRSEPSSTALSAHSSLSHGTPSPPATLRSSRMLLKASVKSLQYVDVVEDEELASTYDDLIVHCGDNKAPKQRKPRQKIKASPNPHHEMLRTNKTEEDMITWNSNYKTKGLEVSAADEFSKKAEIVSKQIAIDFFAWYSAMGEVEFKSELKCPGDIEQLFQVWFDEHASRGLVLDPRIMTCVLQTVANGCGLPQASCPNVLKRQVEFDINAESTPSHTVAFGRCLPQSMKHIPPDNQTEKQWRGVRAPEDLKTMACVWDDIKHLSSTKVFERWLAKRPLMAMPPCLRGLGKGDAAKKQLFVVPSDFVMGRTDSSEEDLALPVSKFDLELKTVLSELMN